jgi:hypothetical protein
MVNELTMLHFESRPRHLALIKRSPLRPTRSPPPRQRECRLLPLRPIRVGASNDSAPTLYVCFLVQLRLPGARPVKSTLR